LTISPQQTVAEAASSMVHNGHGMLVVVNSADRQEILGVLTDQDILEKITATGKQPAGVCVADIMTKNVVTIAPNATLTDVALLMKEKKVKRLPVMYDRKLVGVISATDLINKMIKTKKDLLDVALEF